MWLNYRVTLVILCLCFFGPSSSYAHLTNGFYLTQFNNAELVNPIKKHLVYKPRPAIATSIQLIDTFQTGHVKELQLFAPIYPTLARQTILSPPQLIMQPAPSADYPKVIEELSELHRKIFVANLVMPQTATGYVATLKADVILNQIHLVDLQPDEQITTVPALTVEEQANYLRATPVFDFDAPAFENWLTVNNLHPNYNETRLKFAERVYTYISTHFSYFYRPVMKRTATYTIQAGKTDCGGFSILYASILRYHAIPARAVAGRWAQVGVDDQDCECHVKSEFYLDHIGWIPVDVTSAVLFAQLAKPLQFFGKDAGRFLVMHVDPEFILNTMYGHEKTIFMQDFISWVRVPGRFEEKNKEVWSVFRIKRN